MAKGVRLTILMVVVACALSLAYICRVAMLATYKLTLHELLMGGTASACFMAIGVAGLACFGAVYRYETLGESRKYLASSCSLALIIWLWPILLSFVFYNRGLTPQGWFGISTGLSVAFIAVANGFFLLARRK